LALLHPIMQRLMVECFQAGHSDPSKRPTPSQWFHAICQVQADQAFLKDVQQLELQLVKRQLRAASVHRRRTRNVAASPRRPRRRAEKTRRRVWAGLACSLLLFATLTGAYVLETWHSARSPPAWELPDEYGEGKPTPELWKKLANEK
jgi:hypothetical protein